MKPLSASFLLAILVAALGAVQSQAQGNAVTYQGRLQVDGQPANGAFDLLLTLHDGAAGGTQLDPSLTRAPAPVANGLFTVSLDFGPDVLAGPERWLPIGVRTNGNIDAYVSRATRQPVTTAPSAILAGQVCGPVPGNQLSTNVARLNRDARFTGAVVFDNLCNRFTGAFTGNGARVSNGRLESLNSSGMIALGSFAIRDWHVGAGIQSSTRPREFHCVSSRATEPGSTMNIRYATAVSSSVRWPFSSRDSQHAPWSEQTLGTLP